MRIGPVLIRLVLPVSILIAVALHGLVTSSVPVRSTVVLAILCRPGVSFAVPLVVEDTTTSFRAVAGNYIGAVLVAVLVVVAVSIAWRVEVDEEV